MRHLCGMDDRWLDRDAVATYLRVRVDRVARLVKAGKVPQPSYHLGPRSPRWDRLQLDALFGDVSVRLVNVDDVVRENVAKIRASAPRRARRPIRQGGRH